jgi:hypothetical protein
MFVVSPPLWEAPERSACFSLEKVAVRAGHEVSMEVDNNISLIGGDPQGILEQKHPPRPMHLLNIIIIIINDIKLYNNTLFNYLKT